MKKYILLVLALVLTIALVPNVLAVYGGRNYVPPTTTTTTTTASSGTGGGSVGGSSITNTKIDFTVESSKEVGMRVLDKTTFTAAGGSHTAKLKEVGADYVVLSVTSEEVLLTIYVGEKKYIDFNNDGFNDLKITLKSIVLKKATILFESLAAKITVTTEEQKLFAPPVGEEITPEAEPTITSTTVEKTLNWGAIIAIATIIGLAVMIYGVKELHWFEKEETAPVRRRSRRA